MPPPNTTQSIPMPVRGDKARDAQQGHQYRPPGGGKPVRVVIAGEAPNGDVYVREINADEGSPPFRVKRSNLT